MMVKLVCATVCVGAIVFTSLSGCGGVSGGKKGGEALAPNPVPGRTVSEVAVAIAAKFDENQAIDALFMALEKGYGLRQVVDAILSETLASDGDVLGVDRLVVRPAGVPSNVIVAESDDVAARRITIGLEFVRERLQEVAAELGVEPVQLLLSLSEQGYRLGQIVEALLLGMILPLGDSSGEYTLLDAEGIVIVPGNSRAGVLDLETPDSGADADADRLFQEWYERLPSENAGAESLLPASAGPPGSLFGVRFRDDSAYDVFLVETATMTGTVLFDRSGEPLFEHSIRNNGIRLVFHPSGDALDIELLDEGYLLTAVLNSTVPPSVLVFDVALDGTTTLDSDATEIAGVAGMSVPVVARSLQRRTAYREGARDDCVLVLDTIQDIHELACDLYDGTTELPVGKLCKVGQEALKQAKERGFLDEEEYQVAKGRLNVACKGAVAAKKGWKFFKRLNGFGLSCILRDFAEDASRSTNGKSLSENVCAYVFPECPEGAQRDLLSGECHPICDGDTVFNAASGQCECPPGLVLGFGSTCVCPGDTTLNAVTGACECPPGQIRDDSDWCLCPGNQFMQPDGSCACPARTELGEDGFCRCPDDRVVNSEGLCVCPEGAFWRDDLERCVCDPSEQECPCIPVDWGDEDTDCLTCDEFREDVVQNIARFDLWSFPPYACYGGMGCSIAEYEAQWYLWASQHVAIAKSRGLMSSFGCPDIPKLPDDYPPSCFDSLMEEVVLREGDTSSIPSLGECIMEWQ